MKRDLLLGALALGVLLPTFNPAPSVAASGGDPLVYRKGEVPLTPAPRSWEGVPYLLKDPAALGSLPREGGPQPEVQSALELGSLTFVSGYGHCAEVPVAPLDANRIQIHPGPAGAKGDLPVEAIRFLDGASGKPLSDVQILQRSDAVEPLDAKLLGGLKGVSPWVVVNPGPRQALLLCVDVDQSALSGGRYSNRVDLPGPVLSLGAPSDVSPGGSIRLEARMSGAGSRGAPEVLSLVAEDGFGTPLTFQDTGKGGDVTPGDGIFTALATAPSGGDARFTVRAIADEGGRKIHREAQIRVPVLHSEASVRVGEVTAASGYVRIPLGGGAKAGMTVEGAYGKGDSLLGWVSVRTSEEQGEIVAYLPRYRAYDLADTLVVNGVPEGPKDAGWVATFALP